jgi:hypothetical protein
MVCEHDVFEILTEPPKKGTAGGAGTSSVEDGERKAKQPKPGHQIDTIVFALQLPLLKLSVDHSVVFFCHPGRATKFRASVKAAGTVIGTIPTGTGGKR